MEIVKHEIKSQLAKLLATEDLVVEHRKVETAQFNVRSRVLTLPNWDRASNNVYDSLVAHEVGHALFTPDRDWWLEYKISQQFVNIVEDARIEKLMKRRYAGLAKTFYNGYNELNDRDFFEVNGKDLTTFNLADRINLYYKIGSWVDISFNSTEAQIVSLIDKCETFDDVLEASKALFDYCKSEFEKNQNKQQEQNEEQGLGISISKKENDLDDMTDEELLEELDKPQPAPDNDPAQLDTPSYEQGGGVDGNLDIQTADALEDALKDLTNMNSDHENEYVELPKVDLKNIIIPNSYLHNNIDIHWKEEELRWEESEVRSIIPDNLFDEVDAEFVKFKRSAQKEVNYLVKEFECKKSASAYARTTTAKTGVLDTAKLHTYKFNEDLFKKVNVVPDGKNHGLIFVLDWSGSMAHVMFDTIKQLYNLLWFCKKVNIPFEVYAFTNEYPSPEGIHRTSYEKKEGVALIEETFSLINLFTSKVRAKDLENQMKNIFRLGYCFIDSWRQYTIPIGMNLSGTPLNESLVSLHQIIPQFKTEYKLEKVQCVILTDGEGAPLRYSKEFQRHWDNNPYLGSRYISDQCVIRNRKTGYNYSCAGLGHWADVTDLLLKDLRQSFPNTNFIGIRVLGNRDAGQFIRRYTGYGDDKYNIMISKWRKDKSFSIKNSGYHTYFGLSANALANDDEFEVKEDATKAQIRSAFKKSLKSKKMNKKVLGEFIELVA